MGMSGQGFGQNPDGESATDMHGFIQDLSRSRSDLTPLAQADMDTAKAAFILFSLIFKLSSAAQTSLTAEPGQSSIMLPCQVPDNSPVYVVEWSRANSTSEYVLLYRDEQLDPERQLASFRNRVDLVVRPVKGGNVSLVLQNVTNDDGGTYECRVFPEKTKKWKRAVLSTKPISVVILDVVPPDVKDDQGARSGSCQRHGGLISMAVFAAVVCLAVASL